MRPPAAPGAELLLALARGAPGDAGWPAADAAAWDVAAALALAHGIAPLLHAWSLAEGPLLPALFVRTLQRARAAEVAVEARREAALLRALAALGGDGAVPALLLKGAASARALYPSPELRPRGDLDLLVSPARFAEAVARLERAGFRHHPKVRGTAEEQAGWHERTLLDPADPACVLDLHQELLQTERQGLCAEGLLARGRPAPGLGDAALLPAPEDALLSCVVSLGAHELRSPLVIACDLALLLARCDLAVVAQRAAQARIERMLVLALAWLQWLAGEEAAALWGVPVPRTALAALLARAGLGSALRAALRAVAARYDLLRQPLARPEQLLRKGLLIDRPWDAVRFASATLRRRFV